VSGSRYSDDAQVKELAADYARRLRLRANESLPLVFFDVAIKSKRIGRWGGGSDEADGVQ
jgi:hypothetical protein